MEYLYFEMGHGHIGVPLIGQCRFVPMPTKMTWGVRYGGKLVPIIDLDIAFEGKRRGRAGGFIGNLLVVSTPHPVALLIDSECLSGRPAGHVRHLNTSWLEAIARDYHAVCSNFRP